MEFIEFKDFEVEYDNKHDLFENMKKEAEYIITEKIKEKKLKIHSICSRVKEKTSLYSKIENTKICNPFNDIKDIVGVRVICLFIDDLPKVKSVINEAFEVLEEDNKIEKCEINSFGYMSVHYICKLKSNCSGPRYDKIRDISFEVQVRTILMDAWANISHYLDYKSENSIPSELKKNFYALSGLCFVADTQFQTFLNDSKKSYEIANEKINKTLKTELNADTLRAYLNYNYSNRDRNDSSNDLSELIEEIYSLKIKTVEELDDKLKKASEAFEYFENNFPPGETENEHERFNDIGVVRVSLQILYKNEKYENKNIKKTRDQFNLCQEV